MGSVDGHDGLLPKNYASELSRSPIYKDGDEKTV
jgi:hypothetical protein